MRLFIAINFDKETKARLLVIQNSLRLTAHSASYTRGENMHLTLVFLGEIPEGQLPAIKALMDDIPAEPFLLKLKGIGAFGDTWWVGIERNAKLMDLQQLLAQRLRVAGFAVEGRPYRPHLTLARKVVLPPGCEWDAGAFEPINFQVNTIVLMESRRTHGLLTYTPIHKRELSQ